MGPDHTAIQVRPAWDQTMQPSRCNRRNIPTLVLGSLAEQSTSSFKCFSPFLSLLKFHPHSHMNSPWPFPPCFWSLPSFRQLWRRRRMSPQETRRLNAPQKEVPALASSSFSLCLAVSWPVLSHIRVGKCDMWVYGAVTHTCREM